jgi:protease-4
MRSLCLALLVMGASFVGLEKTWAQSDESAPPIVAVFSLSGQISESPTSGQSLFGPLDGESLKDLVARMKKTIDDDQVQAVVLLPSSASLGLPQVEELRRVLDDIRAAGKEVYVHAEGLSTRDLALVAGATKVSLVPTAAVMITGIRAEQPYLRGLLDLIGVQPDFMTCGAFKSAGEMFMRHGPSEEADQMTGWLLDSMYETTVDLIAEGRGVSAEQARGWIDTGLYTADQAQQAGIIDAVQFRQDFTAELKTKYGDDVQFEKKYGKKKPEQIDLSSPLGLLQLWAKLLAGPAKPRVGKTAIAVVYVEGPIMPGEAEPSPFSTGGVAYSTPIAKALEDAANDDSIKAVVLRIDSPGGSATASEIILDATRRVKAEKPLLVSMGNVAGSGGYYVACASDTIFADASTITGSIGVVSGKFATTAMWDKVGVSWKTYGRGANSGLLSSQGVFSPEERERMRGLMDEVYEVFKSHVVSIRGDRLKKDIDELAGGRVFTGRQALQMGLVDRLGGLDEAIAQAAEEAGLEKYEVRVLPKPKNFMEQLLSDLGGEEPEEDRGTISLSAVSLPTPRSPSLLEAALPYLEGCDPQRVRAIKSALRRLSLLERENVILTMPEIQIGD